MRALVTGGAGFIGSHLADALLARGDDVVVLDDLSTGADRNVPEGCTLVRGSVADASVTRDAARGVDVVFHQAALGSVPRSIDDPVASETANVIGTLNVLLAARDAGARRVVLASSSSVYGGADVLPTPESTPTMPRSPYAVTKLAAEEYARVCSDLYGIETVVLRYFNVFGPRQRADSQYAAVVPRFIAAVLRGERPVIHGDGLQSRDFTYVDNVVVANLLAADVPGMSGLVANIACGSQHSILDLLAAVNAAAGTDVAPDHVEARAGDVRQSRADITLARKVLGFEPVVEFAGGIARTVDWFRRGPFLEQSATK